MVFATFKAFGTIADFMGSCNNVVDTKVQCKELRGI